MAPPEELGSLAPCDCRVHVLPFQLHLRRRLTGYETATPNTIWRRFVSTPGDITLGPEEFVVRLRSRTYSPVVRSAASASVSLVSPPARVRVEFAVREFELMPPTKPPGSHEGGQRGLD